CEASADFIAQITHSARYSHTPYSNQPAALGLQLKGGGSVRAGAIENAAFNPGLNPLQSALSGLALRQIGLEDGDVTRAVLVAGKGPISYDHEAALLRHYGLDLEILPFLPED
ncbi:MAG: hypothetical protein AAF418_04265, partial [Pseudomonadota bacterium]